jgi:hypothetical protein
MTLLSSLGQSRVYCQVHRHQPTAQQPGFASFSRVASTRSQLTDEWSRKRRPGMCGERPHKPTEDPLWMSQQASSTPAAIPLTARFSVESPRVINRTSRTVKTKLKTGLRSHLRKPRGLDNWSIRHVLCAVCPPCPIRCKPRGPLVVAPLHHGHMGVSLSEYITPLSPALIISHRCNQPDPVFLPLASKPKLQMRGEQLLFSSSSTGVQSRAVDADQAAPGTSAADPCLAPVHNTSPRDMAVRSRNFVRP